MTKTNRRHLLVACDASIFVMYATLALFNDAATVWVVLNWAVAGYFGACAVANLWPAAAHVDARLWTSTLARVEVTPRGWRARFSRQRPRLFTARRDAYYVWRDDWTDEVISDRQVLAALREASAAGSADAHLGHGRAVTPPRPYDHGGN